ncbi:FAD-binding protein [Thermoleophilia bacterium SCSIO 60948]|nr:FAD-binding protein [Thermoleophilia bacterium SCSIO 60948]
MVEDSRPLALVRPRTTAEIQAAVRAAAEHDVSVVPRGAGTGLSGGSNATPGSIVICTELMTSVRDVNAGALTATCEPGILNADLGKAVAEEGLHYAPDPASYEISSIGGNVATNAGGLCCVKYGVTRDALMSVELVTADGEAHRIGSRTRKNVAGYDLLGLACGSEGTLGVISEVTVRLLPSPPPAHTLAASFPDLRSAGEAIMAIVRELRPSMLEVMDRTTINAVEDFKPQGLDRDAAAMLYAKTDSGGDVGAAEIERMRVICEEHGADLAMTTDEEAEGRMITAARRLAYTALEHTGTTALDDVAVPIDRIGELFERTERIAERNGVTIGTFGHAGDGNMHPTIVYDQDDADELERARTAFADLVDATLELDGTLSGEHGVGLLKRPFLDAELGSTRRLHQAVKDAIDPAGLFNPGKSI